ncbi:hypothetical protein [uncultured Methanobrevibacter sp.]|jgi:hypothetical protein|uniref:hypothetical protein n=1 Tax=uncultured Methanobrevibacter sp. TaxID=253161 RepID=UPI0025CD44B1|nr:hypothetical protein [uncultured Methanobrevibacter sp.]
MTRKITALLIVLIFSVCLASIAFAENNSVNESQLADDGQNTEINNANNQAIEDTSNYIKVTSISGREFKFNDGFTGFCLSSTGTIETGDTFTSGAFANSQTENYVKLAIIEAYKLGKENNLGEIISKIVNGNMDTGDEVIKAVMDSNEQIGQSKTVNIDNTTEATFTFELLKSTDEDHIECLGYTVSKKPVEPVISGDESASDDKQSDDNNGTQPAGNVTPGNNDKQADSGNATPEKNQTDDKNSKDNKTEPKKADNKVVKNDTTIVKNTTTVIENNTTIVHNNVKEVNNTTAPKNNTATNLLKAGYPIIILLIVIVIAVVAVVIKRRE